MTIEKISPEHQVLESATFGKNCRRCNAYFLTRNRMDDCCPWCVQVEAGQGHEVAAKMAENETFDGF